LILNPSDGEAGRRNPGATTGQRGLI